MPASIHLTTSKHGYGHGHGKDGTDRDCTATVSNGTVGATGTFPFLTAGNHTESASKNNTIHRANVDAVATHKTQPLHGAQTVAADGTSTTASYSSPPLL